MPTYRVKLFAYLKDKFGPEIEVESEAKAHALIEALQARGIPMNTSRLAVNNEFVLDDIELQERDELAVIPPVSGG